MKREREEKRRGCEKVIMIERKGNGRESEKGIERKG